MNYFSLIVGLKMIAEQGAAASADAAAQGGCAGGGWSMLLIYAAIIGVMYLLMIRPQKKRQKQEEELRRNVEIGDEIVTIGGICGRIVSIKDEDIIVIETGADRTKLKMKNWAISTNETAAARVAAEAPQTEKKGIGSSLSSLFNKKSSEDEDK